MQKNSRTCSLRKATLIIYAQHVKQYDLPRQIRHPCYPSRLLDRTYWTSERAYSEGVVTNVVVSFGSASNINIEQGSFGH